VKVSRTESPLPERALLQLGVDPNFVEAVLGDLAEEYALRALRDGGPAARWWYTREVFRSAPHFLRSWFRHARRYERLRLTGFLGALVLTTLAVLVALSMRDGPPTRLAGASDTIIVNNREPVQLPVEVLDAAGHVLHATGVRYQQLSGNPVRMSAAGRVTCERRGDALVRASLGALRENFLLRCRPIRRFVDWQGGLWLAIGDSAQELPIRAVGVDGTPETILTGSATVRDSDIASLHGLSVHPKAPGATLVDVWVGGVVDVIPVTVFKRVRTSDALRPFEFFASPLRLASGQTRQWHISVGSYFVSFRSDTAASGASAALTLSTVGATCSQFGDAYNYFCLAAKDASLVVSAPGGTGGAREFSGYLAVRRK
jgi:hypothetical protein